MMTTKYRIRVYAGILGGLATLFVLGNVFGPRRAQVLGPVYSGIEASEVDRVEISGAALSMVLKLEGDTWILDDGGRNFPARSDRIVSFVDEAAGSTLVRRITANESLWPDFGLSEIGATEVTLHSSGERGGERTASAVWGASAAVPGLSYVRKPGEPDVYSSDGQLGFYLGQPATYWSYLRVLPESVNAADVVRVSSRIAGEVGDQTLDFSYDLNREPVQAAGSADSDRQEVWTADGDQGSLDDNSVSRFLREVTNLVGADFHRAAEAAADLNEIGGIEISLTDGRTYRLSILRSGGVLVCRGSGQALPGDPFGGLLYRLEASTVRRLFPELRELLSG